MAVVRVYCKYSLIVGGKCLKQEDKTYVHGQKNSKSFKQKVKNYVPSKK